MWNFTRRLIVCFLFINLLLVVSCGSLEDEPAALTIRFELAANSKGPVRVEEVQLALNELVFDGERESGKAVSFRNAPEESLITLSGNSEMEYKQFNIPQGVYTRVLVKLSLAGDEQSPSVRLTARSAIPKGPLADLEMIFEYSVNEILTLIAEEASAAGGPMVVKDGNRDLTIRIDASHWLQPITSQVWESAVPTSVGGKDKVIVNAHTNPGIYQALSNRLGQSIRAVY